MPKYKGKEENGVLKIKKSNEKIADEDRKLIEKMIYINTIEIMEAIKKIGKNTGNKVSFTYDKLKNKDIKEGNPN